MITRFLLNRSKPDRELYLIDLIRWKDKEPELEIVSRLIHHAETSDEAKKHARGFLSGVHFLGVQGVRISDSFGREMCCWRLDGELIIPLAKHTSPTLTDLFPRHAAATLLSPS